MKIMNGHKLNNNMNTKLNEIMNANQLYIYIFFFNSNLFLIIHF